MNASFNVYDVCPFLAISDVYIDVLYFFMRFFDFLFVRNDMSIIHGLYIVKKIIMENAFYILLVEKLFSEKLK
jgi:hypothetical protein